MAEELKTRTGIITFIYRRHGYGFIQDEGGEVLFFHFSGVLSPKFEEIKEGNTAEYYVVPSLRGKLKKAIGIVV